MECMEIINQLIQDYQVDVFNRKAIVDKIYQLIRTNYGKDRECDNRLYQVDKDFYYRDYYVSDYKLLLELINQLSSDNYSIKKVFVEDFFVTNDGEKKLFGETYIIGDSNFINSLGERYSKESLRLLLKNNINNGNSIIVTTPNLFNGLVKPKRNEVNHEFYEEFNVSGIMANISCYLHDDELKEVIDRIKEYIDRYTCDFTGISLEDIIDKINSERKVKKY